MSDARLFSGLFPASLSTALATGSRCAGLVLALGVLAAGAVQAQPAGPAPAPTVAAVPGTATPRVDAREARQAGRIASGVASGQLTPHEQHRLGREQRHIAQAEAHAKADGTVTAQERQRLARLQNHASRDIHHQKHDAQVVAQPAH